MRGPSGSCLSALDDSSPHYTSPGDVNALITRLRRTPDVRSSIGSSIDLGGVTASEASLLVELLFSDVTLLILSS